MSRAWRILAIAATLLCEPAAVVAQGVEIAPIAGYRFGGDFFEIVTDRSVDRDGAAAFGAVLDVPLRTGFQVEALFTHQSARILLPASPFGPAERWRIAVDHYQGGGLQEFGRGRVRPFLTGTLGLTRYAASGDSEVRFALGAGGGVKLWPRSAVGLRLDGRVFATFVDVDGRALRCAPGWCLANVHADVVWQAEFSAGVAVRLGS